MKTHLVTALLLISVGFAHATTLSYLRFEEGSGYGAYDETGLLNGEVLFGDVTPGGGDSGYSGWSTNVPSATVLQTGEVNIGSLHYDAGEYVDLSNANALSLGFEFTIELFMKPDMPITASPLFGFSPVSGLSYMLSETDDNLFFAGWFQSELVNDSASLVLLNEWQHFALVVDSTTYAIYINGQLQDTASIPAGGEGPYWFPGNPEGGRMVGDGFRGWIDEFRISDEALSPSQFLNAAIPEPGTLGLLGLGAILVAIRKRTRA